MTTAPFELEPEAWEALSPAERDEWLVALAQVNRGVEESPLWRYAPHRGEYGWKLANGVELDGSEQRGQEEFHEMTPARVEQGAYVAGNRSGKTHGGAVDALIQTLPSRYLPPWLLRFKVYDDDYEYRCRVVGVDLPNWLTKTMLPKLRKLIPPEALHKGAFDKAWHDRSRLLTFADGSWWDFLTHDMEIDSFAGADVDRVWWDEEPPGERGRSQFEESSGRLVDRDGDMRWTLTPLLGLNFVYHELTDEHGQPRDDGEVKVVRGDIDHNPHLSERGKRKFLKRFEKDPLKMAARKSGRWVHFAGLIYDEWNENAHVIPDRELPRANARSVPLVPVYEAIDPGINEDHRTGLVFGWLGHDDVFEVFHSVKFDAGTIVEDVADYIHGFRAANNYRPRMTFIDPSAKNMNHQTGRSIQDAYRDHRIHTFPAQNSHELGFNAVKERLRSGRLLVHASNVELIKQFGEYRWKSPRGAAENAPKPEPIKRNDDVMDALRYDVVMLPKPPSDRAEIDREAHLSEADRAFRHSIDRAGQRRRVRIGGVPT